MPQDDSIPPPPELIVLDALKETCELVRKHNSNPEIAKAALQWETRIADRMQKLQPEAQAVTPAMAA
jgi:hypothetical protein